MYTSELRLLWAPFIMRAPERSPVLSREPRDEVCPAYSMTESYIFNFCHVSGSHSRLDRDAEAF